MHSHESRKLEQNFPSIYEFAKFLLVFSVSIEPSFHFKVSLAHKKELNLIILEKKPEE